MAESKGEGAASTVTIEHVRAALDQIDTLVDAIRHALSTLPSTTLLMASDKPTLPPIGGNCPPPDEIGQGASPLRPNDKDVIPRKGGNCPPPEESDADPDV